MVGFRALDGGDLRLFQVGSSSMARTTPCKAGRSCGSGQEKLTPLVSGNVVFVGTFGQVGADLLQLRIGAEGVEAGHGEVELAATALFMNSLRVPDLASMIGACRPRRSWRVAVSASMSAFTLVTRPLTNSEANEKRPASSSRILRRGPSPGFALGQDLPCRAPHSAFSVETLVS